MSNDLEKIHALIGQYCRAALQKDPESLLQLYDAQVRIFDLWDKASVRGMAEWAPIVRHWLGNLGTETVHVEFEQVEVQAGPDLAVVTAFVHYQARDARRRRAAADEEPPHLVPRPPWPGLADHPPAHLHPHRPANDHAEVQRVSPDRVRQKESGRASCGLLIPTTARSPV